MVSMVWLMMEILPNVILSEMMEKLKERMKQGRKFRITVQEIPDGDIA